MLQKLLSTALVLAFFLVGVPVQSKTVSDYPAGVAANGIGMSRHNLGWLGRVLTTNATTQICVFCHTPHFGNESDGLRPLWNRGNAVKTGSYLAYGTTLAGTTVADGDIGSTTLACLSCHDGVTTFDNLVNAPGKDGITFPATGGNQGGGKGGGGAGGGGGGQGGGGKSGGGGTDLGWTFFMPDKTTSSTAFDHFAGNCNSCHSGDSVQSLKIGAELFDDHPVSVTYTPGVASLRVVDTTIGLVDLASGLGSTNANIAQNRWSVFGFISADAKIGDLLRDGKVECSSCHDPHFRNLSWDEAEPTWVSATSNWCGNNPENCSDGLFLRRVGGNTGSGLCRTCHNK